MSKIAGCLYLDFENKIKNLVSCIFNVLTFVLLSTSALAQDNDISANPGHSRVIEVGTAVTLDGSKSTSPSGLRLTYAWSLIEQPLGSLADLSEADTLRPIIVPDFSGDYLAELIVTDSEGNSSAAKTVLLTTGNVPPVALAGEDRFTTVGQSLRFDPEGTYDANGDRLEATWSIMTAPADSTAEFIEDTGGRYEFIPDVSGNYTVQLSVEDVDGAISTDTVMIYAAPLDEPVDANLSNIAPVANGGFDQTLTLGEPHIFDGSGSTDVNGDALSYQWSLISWPDASSVSLESLATSKVSLSPDVSGSYVLQLKVTDLGGLIDYDTIVLSSEGLSPNAMSGGPVANTDGNIAQMEANVDASSSTTGAGGFEALAYDWSVLGLSAGESEITSPSAISTAISFPETSDDSLLDSEAAENAVEFLQKNSLIIFEEAKVSGVVQGASIIGGKLQGEASQFGLSEFDMTGQPVLTVGGEIQDGTKFIAGGGNVVVDGDVEANITFQNGGEIINQVSLDFDDVRENLEDFSQLLEDLPSTPFSINYTNNGVVLDVTPNEFGVAVAEVSDGENFFNKDNGTIELIANGADTIIINVRGHDVEFDDLTFIGSLAEGQHRGDILWNFHQADAVDIKQDFEGFVLAAHADVKIQEATVYGGIVGDTLDAEGDIKRPLFKARGLIEVEIEPTNYALVQLALTDTDNVGFGPSFDSTVLTTGNLRPVAGITQSGGSGVLTPGIEVGFDATPSFDGDNDSLSYNWSILSKPEGSTSGLTSASAVNASVTPDKVGLYVIQLIVSDGELISRPVTLAFEAQNTAPTANAGLDQSVFKGELVSLDGSSSSDPDGDDLTYFWSIAEKPDNSQSVLSDETSVSLTFVADVKGEYVLSLVVNDGIQNSETDSVNITVENRAPVAAASGKADGVVGDIIMLTALNSSDPDGDALSYSWTLEGPQGSSAILSDTSAIDPMFTADVGGVYSLTLTVSDGALSSAPTLFVVTIDEGSGAPTLESIGNQTIALGANLSVQLVGTDPDGDDLFYSVNPLPLPVGASFDVNTGVFSFRPDALSPESFSFTFGVSDGALTDSETITVTVTNDDETPTTEYTGRVVDSITDDPIPGVIVMIGDQVATTDINGGFTLNSLAPGTAVVWIITDENTALSSDGRPYGAAQVSVVLLENVMNRVEGDIKLSPVSATGTIAGGQPVVIENANLGVKLEVPEGSVLGEGYTSRYWRILINSVNGNENIFVSIAELEMATDPGQASILQNGTVTSNTFFSNGSRPQLAFDGDLNSEWSSGPGGASGGWIAYDLGAGNEATVVEVSITARANPNFADDQTPIDFDVQTSNDGATWTTVSNIVTPTDWRTGEERSFIIGEPYDGSIGITGLSSEQANSLPPNIVPCQLFSLEPKTLRIIEPLTLTVQNYDDLPAGTIVDVWVYDGERFSVVGNGTVSANGQDVVAVLNDLSGGQLIALAPRATSVEFTNDQPRNTYVPGLLNEGNFSTSYSSPSYSSLGTDRALTFVYNATSASPNPLISTRTIFPENSGLPLSTSQMVSVGDTNLSFNSQTSLALPIGSDEEPLSPTGGESIVQTAIFDASQLPTGIYPVNLISVSQFSCSTVGRSFKTEITVNNQVGSSIGAGWSIAEISRLQLDGNGGATIINGNGSISKFSPSQALGSVRETFAADVGGDAVPVVEDIDGNGTIDVVAIDEQRGTIRFFINEGGSKLVEDKDLEFVIALGKPLSPRPFGFGADSSPIRGADFDNDGMFEFVNASDDRNAIQVIGKVGDKYEIIKSIENPFSVQEVRLEDFDNDGFIDIIATNGVNIRFYINSGAGEFNLEDDIFLGNNDFNMGDIDGDGHIDIVTSANQSAVVFFSEGDFTGNSVIIPMPNPVNTFLGQLIQIGDTDLDGDNDILISTVPNITYVENLGNRSFRTVELIRPAGFGEADNITLADVTGDGLLDALADERIPQPRYSLFKKSRDGDYEVGEAVIFGHPIGESLVIDVDGDGVQDLVSKARFQLYVDFGEPLDDGIFNSPFGDFTSLNRNDDGTFTRRFTNGTVINYTAEGLQSSTVDRNGNETSYAYDIEGQLTSVTDPTGLVTTLTYKSGGLIDRVTDPAGRSSVFTHNEAGNLVEIRDTEDQPIRYDYDEQRRMVSETSKRDLTTVNSYGAGGRYTGSEFADGTSVGLSVARTIGLPDLDSDTNIFVRPEDRMTMVKDGRGNVSFTEVNEFGAPIRILDALGRETLYERNADNLVTAVIQPSSVTPSGTIRMELIYDNRGNLTSQTEAVGTALERTTSYEYEPVFSRPVKITDADGFEILMEYDEFGNRTRMIDPLGGEENMAYNSLGQAVSSRDKNDNLTTFDYDNFRRLSLITDASFVRQQMLRDDAGNVAEMIEDLDGPQERRTFMSYDGLNRKITETAADGGITTYAYDGNDNVISVTDPTGIIETRSYDQRDRLETINDPATGATILAYDADSNLIRQTDGAGEVTIMEYDEVSRLVKTTDALEYIRRFTYDLRDNRTSVTDARGNITTFTYDELDRAVTRTNPVGNVWQFGYDARDNRITSTKPDGVVLTSSYDDLSRMLSLSGGSVGAISRNYSYDPQSNLTSANDNLNGFDGAQNTFTYDQENRVATGETSNLFGQSTLNNSFTFAYDALDRRASMIDSFGGTTSYGYDAVDRLSSVTTPQNAIFEMEYDLAGRSLRRAAPNASEIIRNYEGLTGRLSRYTQSMNGAVFSDFTYSYTARGNIASIVEGGDIIRTRNYNYDAIERLTDVTVPELPFQNEVYELDEEGNRITSHLSNAHVTDEANRLTEDVNYTYVYDLNGNLTGKLAKANSGRSDWSYAYDALDQLIEVTQAGNPVERYRYDAFGRRSLIETIGGKTIGIVNQGTDRVLDLANDNTAAELEKRYTHSASVDEPLQVETFTAGIFEDVYTYHADHLGSIRFLTDASGNIANDYDYDSYGRPQFGVTSFDQPFQYTGREWDEATGLYHYRARQYDPETGRFLQEDPLFFGGGDLNIYRYVGSNPINFTDPSGLSAAAETAGTAGIITGVLAGGRTIAQTVIKQGGRALAKALQAGRINALSGIGGLNACNFSTVAAAITSDTPGDRSICGASAESGEDEVIVTSPNPGGGGDCEEFRQEVRDLKERTNQLKGCKPGMSEVQLLFRLDAWKAQSLARERRDLFCPKSNPNPSGEQTRLILDRQAVAKCLDLLRGLRGR